MAAYNGPMIVPMWLLALGISLPLTVGLAWRLQFWAPRWGLMDSTDRRKPHHGDVPVGGLAVVIGGVGGLVPALLQEAFLGWWVVGAIAVAVVGLLDDRRSLSPGLKLLGQTGAAVVALQGGLDVTVIDVFDVEIYVGLMGALLSVLWVVTVTNAFNLTDGLDGLACGAAILLALAATAMSALSGDGVTLSIACALGGSAIGFLGFNRHPARLFLGDGGSYFLGFLLALGTLRAAQSGELTAMPLGVLALMWGYPIVDTLWAIIRRVREKRPITSPDRAHLHHRLLAVSGRYRATVWTLYGLFAVLGALSVGLWMINR